MSTADSGGLRRSPGWFWGIAGLLAVIVVALAVVTVSWGLSVHSKDSQAGQRDKALAVARQQAINLGSIDYRNLQADIQRILTGSTGQFRETFQNGSSQITQGATQQKTVSTVQQSHVALVSFSGDSAEAIVSLTTVTTSVNAKQGQANTYRYQMELSKVGGRWLLSKMELVP
jgi:Mce-associated membrane protein